MKGKEWTRANKWMKHSVLLANPKIETYIPDTKVLNFKEFKTFLTKYRVVFIKPLHGTGGHGIFRITRLRKGYLIQTNKRKRIFTNIKEMYLVIRNLNPGRDFLIQRGINLLSMDNRPIDFRLLVMKPEEDWEFVANLGKIAAKNKFVTNYSQGGDLETFDKIMRDVFQMKKEEIEEFEKEIIELSLLIAKTLDDYFSNVREVGIDIAIDQNKRIFILETNSMPNSHGFIHHPDETVYPKIKNYLKKIGRE